MDHTQIPNDWREWWDERAAMMQYEAGLPLDVAEEEALTCLMAHITVYLERQRGKAGEKKH